jgi:hypothetical protein
MVAMVIPKERRFCVGDGKRYLLRERTRPDHQEKKERQIGYIGTTVFDIP